MYNSVTFLKGKITEKLQGLSNRSPDSNRMSVRRLVAGAGAWEGHLTRGASGKGASDRTG